MKRVDALKNFTDENQKAFENYDQLFWNKLFLKQGELLEKIKNGLCNLAIQQEKEEKRAIYIYCFFLRGDMLNRVFNVYLQAVDKAYIFDQNPIEITINLDFLFNEINELWDELLETRRNYVWKINEYDVNSMILEIVVKNHWKIAFLLRFLFKKIENQKELYQALLQPLKIVRWGEYRDRGEIIFMRDESSIDGRRLKGDLLQSAKTFNILQNKTYVNEVVREYDCKYKMFEFAVFSNCIFYNSEFDNSNLTGTVFENCSFNNCSFQKAILHLVRFEQCEHRETVWEGADFYGVFCKDTNLGELSENQKNYMTYKEEEFDEAIFLYGARQKN